MLLFLFALIILFVLIGVIYLIDFSFALSLVGFLFFIIVLGFFLADRIILARVRGRALAWYDPLLSTIGNCAYQLHLTRPAVFETAFLPHSFFYFKSVTGKNNLLLGKELRNTLSDFELRALITLALIRLQHEKKRSAFATAFLWSLLTLPRRFFTSNTACLFWDFFYFPLEQLLRWQLISKRKIFLCDELAVHHLGTRVDLASAIYKMQNYEARPTGRGLAASMLPYFSLVGTKERRVLNQLLGDCQFSEERYQNLIMQEKKLV